VPRRKARSARPCTDKTPCLAHTTRPSSSPGGLAAPAPPRGACPVDGAAPPACGPSWPQPVAVPAVPIPCAPACAGRRGGTRWCGREISKYRTAPTMMKSASGNQREKYAPPAVLSDVACASINAGN
jgi:hypothetical protein